MQIGIDVGRGYTKALSSHSQGVVKFPSYVAEGRRLDLGNLNNADPVNRLRLVCGPL